MRLLLSSLMFTLFLTGCGDSDAPARPDQTTRQDAQETTSAPPDKQPADPADHGGDTPLVSKPQTLERKSEPCPEDPCSSVTLQWLTFPEDPALTEALENSLIHQLSNGEDEGVSSLAEVADRFLADARKAEVADSSIGWELTSKVAVGGEWRDIANLQLETYEFTGGAHGMPVLQLLNWDRREHRRIELADILQPGKEEAFWAEAAKAHVRWLEQEAQADDEFRDNWPFQQTGDFDMTYDGVELHYNVYSIGPYAMGQPELTVPWNKLDGLIRERYLP
ncbi:hypothetical protein A6D6_04250 [Alcanivorax xiamenensis]|uniref:DUF3298 domain-containing protein n=1 Tax=Alcanivorax xiamenensis TaxID=1177156 RepID=A0ABQ6Y213_9GAMM|nr:DUF3298 and DUF4163 domain-containing protein [Alcanivorax xiamenensis]KAF0801768.1 hypothetical protein A6D6_04250 [Alcanivorax xiamenensis]